MKTTLTSVNVDPICSDRWVVIGSDADGIEYTYVAPHGRHDMGAVEAQAVAARVRTDHLEIEDTEWTVRIPYGSAAWVSHGEEYALIERERDGEGW
jgi:hypothetical protein